MATTYTNESYPHTAVITRPLLSEEPPYELQETDPIWEGACDCQVGTGGTTETRSEVFVSDYTIYTACIGTVIDDVFVYTQLKTGDLISITQREGWEPIQATIEQFSTDNIWVENGVQYGTTIWANEVK